MNMGGFYESTIEHHNPYSINGLRKYLESEGLETVDSGVDEDTHLPLLSWSPPRLARNLALWGLGRLLCGRIAMYEASYLVVRKPGG